MMFYMLTNPRSFNSSTLSLIHHNFSHSLNFVCTTIRSGAEIGETISDEELMEMIREADSNNDDEVTESDFLRIMQKSTR